VNQRTSSTREIAIVLAAIAMVLRLLFAPGLMPGLDAHGAATLTLCTSQGMKVIPNPAAPASQHQKSCPFEGQASAAPADAPEPLRLAAIEYPIIAEFLHTHVSPGRGLIAPPPPQTGPPLALA
jgi:hypothetical protein